MPSGFCPPQWEYSGEDAIYKFSTKFDELYNDHYMEVEGDFMYDYAATENEVYTKGRNEL